MSGKTGKRITGKKPSESQRTSALTDGARGRENMHHVRSGVELNVDRSGPQKQPSRRQAGSESER